MLGGANMQNKEHKSIRQVLKDRGYYIALIVCLAAVAVSGYLFATTAMRVNQNDAVQPSLAAPGADQTDTATPPAADSDAAETFEPVQSADDAVRQAADAVIVWPLSGSVQNGYSVDALAYNATMSDWRVHDGIDIAATLGQTVAAAQAGTVSSVYDDDFLGTVVVIDGTEGLQMVYANLSEMPTVSTGDEVRAGQVIGAVGDTALLEVADEPHLHFAVRKNGTTVDPTSYLP